MKKKKVLLLILSVICLTSNLTSCKNNKNDSSNGSIGTSSSSDNLINVNFDDLSIDYDGTEKKLELTGSLPLGYTVEYKNNCATEVGTYKAIAEIKNSNGEVIKTYRAILNICYPDNSKFETFLDNFFVEYLAGDQLSVNLFCENPSNFGLEHYDASWYSYPGMISAEDQLESVNVFKTYLSELKTFENSPLSPRQEIAYTQINDFLNYQISYYSIEDIDYKMNHYINQFGGYVADFGTYIEAYNLRDKRDVQDVIDYIKCTKLAFPTYVEYAKDKVTKGYAYSDYTLDQMIAYLDDVLESANGTNHYYLTDVLKAKVDSVDFLTIEEVSSFKNQIEEEMTNSFIYGVQELRNGLEKLRGNLSSNDEGYLAKYDNNHEVYLLELNHLLGLNNFNIEDYIHQIDVAFNKNSMLENTALSNLIINYGITTIESLEKLLNSVKICDGNPDEMLVFLKEFAKTIVPELKSEPNITIKNMDDASAKVSNAVAYYMRSPLDNNKQEYITLNQAKLSSNINEVLATLAHEGYPGHLYANVFAKESNIHNISKILTSTAHAEGWATYVELKLYDYAIKNAKSKKEKDIFTYLYYTQLSAFLLETRLDVGIHYQGWTISYISEYLNNLGYNGEAAKEIYELLIESPTSYSSYGFGKLFFFNLHNEAKSILGEYYNEIEFNEMLLSKGWTSLGELENTYQEYMIKKCHKLGIAFND